MKEHILAILCILLLSSVTQLCAQNTSLKTDHYERSKKNKTLTKRTRYLMGTYVNVSLPGQYISTISSVFDLIQNIENSLSTYAPNATLARLNRVHSVHSDPYLKESILLSQDFYNETGGYFDITIGSITKNLYHFGEQESGIPTRQQLKEAYLNIQDIHMDGSTIKSDRNITIDLGGMGKGYAVDKATDYLKKQNINEGVIVLSGDIRCLHLCSIYLQSPYSEEAMFAMVRAKKLNLSISTSGTYRRYAADLPPINQVKSRVRL